MVSASGIVRSIVVVGVFWNIDLVVSGVLWGLSRRRVQDGVTASARDTSSFDVLVYRSDGIWVDTVDGNGTTLAPAWCTGDEGALIDDGNVGA